MTIPFERFDAAAQAAACDTLTAIGSGLVTAGTYSLVTGVGGAALLPGMAALLASRYACSWDPNGPAPGDPASALPGGCLEANQNCLKFTTSPSGGPWGERFQKFISLVDTGVAGGFGSTYWKLTYQKSDGKQYEASLPRTQDEVLARSIYTEGEACACRNFNSQPTTITPETPGIPDTIYTDPDSGCQINVEYKGLVTGQGGLGSFVYKMSPVEESRSDGGRIGGCTFSPVIYTTPPGGGGGPGGPSPPLVGPWNPEWDGGGQTPWGDFLRDLAGGLLGNVLYDQLSKLIEAPYPGVEYRIDPSCAGADPAELPVVIDIPPLKGLDSALTRIDALIPLLQAQKDLKQPICRDRPKLEGEWRTISFRSEETSPFGKSRLRKRFRYRSVSGFGLEQLVNHWASFSFDAGPVIVSHRGAFWGEPKVWASSVDEGKRVIRHAAGEAGLDPDQVGEWQVSGSSNPRFGVSGTMKVDITGGYYWITARDGSSERPLVAKV